MKIGVVQFPGSNCERETKLALQRVGFEPIDCYWHADKALVENLDGFVIVGGFSYEDRVRSGLIASQDPFMRLLELEAAKGKAILGICNGAQILVESGLMGGPIALTHNQRLKDGILLGTGFYNDWVEIQSNHAPTNIPFRVPIAHAEGRFLLDPAFYETLQQAGALFYTYCGENPNGSQHNLAAVSNAAGNIMAMMPHPERTPAGDIILKSFFEHALTKRDGLQESQKFKHEAPPLARHPEELATRDLLTKDRATTMRSLATLGMTWGQEVYVPVLNFTPHTPSANSYHAWVALKIYDNEAISMENTLQELGYPLTLKKLVHWEFSGISAEEFQAIIQGDELFNHQKEYLSEPKTRPCYMIRAKEDELALEKQILFSKLLNKPITLTRDIVWCSSQELSPKAQALLGNPLSHSGLLLT